ncbi:MAG TPA: response regulator [Armatimonadota bacterium]|nr:response regulator [Armatimonadota bacterium]
MSTSKILLVDDEPDVRGAIERRLKREGFDIDMAASATEAAESIAAADPCFDVIIADMSMETENSGLDFLKAAFARDIFSEVIVLTAYGSIQNAVECMKRGAFDYIEKNIPGVEVLDLLVLKIQNAIEHRSSAADVVRAMERRQLAADE